MLETNHRGINRRTQNPNINLVAHLLTYFSHFYEGGKDYSSIYLFLIFFFILNVIYYPIYQVLAYFMLINKKSVVHELTVIKFFIFRFLIVEIFTQCDLIDVCLFYVYP